MEKIKRNIQIRYPDDNSLHSIIVYQSDMTTDGRVVISYYDITAGNIDSYSEIINVNGEWVKNPEHLDWDSYEFIEFDPAFNSSVINSLPDKMELAKPKEMKKPIETDTIALTDNMSKDPQVHRIHHIQMISFANEGNDIINLHPTTYESGVSTVQEYSFGACSSFFSEGRMNGDVNSNSLDLNFRNLNINENDKKDIFEYIQSFVAKGEKINISDNVQFSVETKSNTKFIIDWSSCNSWDLFLSTQAAEQLIVDISNVSGVTYPDDLSSALHYELPLEMLINGVRHSNGVKSSKESVGIKK